MSDQDLRERAIEGLEIVWDAFNHMEHEMYADYVFDALALLKAQEPVVPSWRRGIPFCGKCGRQFGRGFKYCPDCGQAVKWE